MSTTWRLEVHPLFSERKATQKGEEYKVPDSKDIHLAFDSADSFEDAKKDVLNLKIRKGSFLKRQDHVLTLIEPETMQIKRDLTLSAVYFGSNRTSYGPYRITNDKYYAYSVDESVAIVDRLREEIKKRPIGNAEKRDDYHAHVFLVDPVYGRAVTPIPVYQDLRHAAVASSFEKPTISPQELAIAKKEAVGRLAVVKSALHNEAEANLNAGRGLRISIDQTKDPVRRSGPVVKGNMHQGLLFLPIDLLEPDYPQYSDTKGRTVELYMFPKSKNHIPASEDIVREEDVVRALECFERSALSHIEAGYGMSIRRRVIPHKVVEFSNGRRD